MDTSAHVTGQEQSGHCSLTKNLLFKSSCYYYFMRPDSVSFAALLSSWLEQPAYLSYQCLPSVFVLRIFLFVPLCDFFLSVNTFSCAHTHTQLRGEKICPCQGPFQLVVYVMFLDWTCCCYVLVFRCTNDNLTDVYTLFPQYVATTTIYFYIQELLLLKLVHVIVTNCSTCVQLFCMPAI